MMNFNLLSVCLLLSILVRTQSSSLELGAAQNADLKPTRKVMLEDLNLDVLYLCFVDAHPHDLLSLAETNQHFSHLALDIFARQHSEKTIKFDIWDFDPEHSTRDEISDFDTQIRLENYPTILRFLRTFGHLISSLEIMYTTHANHIELQEYLVSYCASSLQKLQIDILDKVGTNFKFFDKVTEPFTKVEELLIRGVVNELGSDTLSFSELFPAVRRLDLLGLAYSNEACIDAHFPHLEEISLSTDIRGIVFYKQIDVENCLNKNPEVKSLVLQLSIASFDSLFRISQIRPDIESLQLIGYRDYINQEITFENVTKLTIKGTALDSFIPLNLNLPKLVEFHCQCGERLDHSTLISFLNQNPQAKKLVVTNLLRSTDIEALTQLHLNLDEISVAVHFAADVTIANFVRSNEHMQRIYVRREKESVETVAEVLRGELGPNWEVTSSQYEMLIERIG